MTAMVICIWHPFHQQSSFSVMTTSISLPEESQARPLFLACKDATLHDLETINGEIASASGVGLLQNPGVRQVLIVLALLAGNKPLAIAIIKNYSPGPDYDQLFGPNSINRTLYPDTGRQIIHHQIFTGVATLDTGCDVWVSLMKHSWASPHPTLLSVALTAPDVASGKALLQELGPLICVHPQFTEAEVSETLLHGVDSNALPELIDFYLTLFNPKKHGMVEVTRKLSRSAARYGGTVNLQILLQHDAADFFGMNPTQHTKKWKGAFLDEPWDDYYGTTGVTTALHTALRYGNVEAFEFLLAQPGGEVQWRDGYGRTAYDYGKHLESLKWQGPIRGLDKMLELLERRGWKASTPEEIKAAECKKPD